MTPEQLLALERRATAGPWHHYTGKSYGRYIDGGPGSLDEVVTIEYEHDIRGCEHWVELSEEDAALITALRNRARALAKLWAAVGPLLEEIVDGPVCPACGAVDAHSDDCELVATRAALAALEEA